MTDIQDTLGEGRGKNQIAIPKEVIIRSEQEGINQDPTNPSTMQEEVTTRSGRKVKIPNRFQC